MSTVRRWADATQFLAAARAFLVEREAEHNLLLGLAGTAVQHPGNYRVPPQFVTVHAGDRVAGAALRTPPHSVVLSLLDDPDAVGALVDAWHGEPLPGVIGPSAIARAFAERWAASSGVRSEREMQQRIFRLARVIAPRAAPGSWRDIEERDRALLEAWWQAFMDEVKSIRDDPAKIVDRWLRRAGRVVSVWEDGGDVVAMAGVGGETPNGVRVGPVYTPPERRGRGYASNLVAALSQRALASGRRFCFLFTDLANPTSNHIYQALGYEPVIDVDQYRFAVTTL